MIVKGGDEKVKYKKKGHILAIGFVLILAVVPLMCCAVGEFGKANVSAFNIDMPSGLDGQSKSSIMKTLGDPDYVLIEDGTEYWGYRNHNGWFLYLYYVSFGQTEAKDLILEFQGEVVHTVYLIDKGSSIGILTAPLSVAN